MKKIMMVMGLCAGIAFYAPEANAQRSNTDAKTNDNSTKNDLNFQKHLHTNLQNPPGGVRKSFATDFPNSGNINWSSEPGIWYVRCDDMSGYHNLTGYRSNGTRVFTAKDLKPGEVPPPVMTYCATNGQTLSADPVVDIFVPGKSTVYMITTTTGRVIFIDNNGSETNFWVDGFATY